MYTKAEIPEEISITQAWSEPHEKYDTVFKKIKVT